LDLLDLDLSALGVAVSARASVVRGKEVILQELDLHLAATNRAYRTVDRRHSVLQPERRPRVHVRVRHRAPREGVVAGTLVGEAHVDGATLVVYAERDGMRIFRDNVGGVVDRKDDATRRPR